jgi:hypothetical protein
MIGPESIWHGGCNLAGGPKPAPLHANERHISLTSQSFGALFLHLHTPYDTRGVDDLGVEKLNLNPPTRKCRSRKVTFLPPLRDQQAKKPSLRNKRNSSAIPEMTRFSAQRYTHSIENPQDIQGIPSDGCMQLVGGSSERTSSDVVRRVCKL